jgi:hypothetical protein
VLVFFTWVVRGVADTVSMWDAVERVTSLASQVPSELTEEEQAAEDAAADAAAAAEARHAPPRGRGGSVSWRASLLRGAGARGGGGGGARRQRSALAAGASALALPPRRGTSELLPVAHAGHGHGHGRAHGGRHHRSLDLRVHWQRPAPGRAPSIGEDVRIIVAEAGAGGAAAVKHERLLSEWPATGEDGFQGASTLRVGGQVACKPWPAMCLG